MAATRQLPTQSNPQVHEDNTPDHSILVERRCLGQTELKVKPGQKGTTNATKPENLGWLDYAHLRVPLPKDLNSSGIFVKQANRKWPEAYFLMRRSSDGYISATGMFKATFPWAQQEEEVAEKDYIKSLEHVSSEEVAGNVWIHPDQALELAEEYGIRAWIAALLDPEPITHGTSDPNKDISSPPPYKNLTMVNGTPEKKVPTDGRRSTRGGKGRSVSPVKKAPESPTKKTPARKIATPRKPRGTTGTTGHKRGKSDATSVDLDEVNGVDHKNETVKVEVETGEASDGEETTKVNVEMPIGHPDLELPQDTEGMLEKAREMVQEAEKISGPSTGKKGKRKAVDMVQSDEDVPLGRDAKRVKAAELELRKERIRRRALMGIAGSLAIGAIVPGLMAAFGS